MTSNEINIISQEHNTYKFTRTLGEAFTILNSQSLNKPKKFKKNSTKLMTEEDAHFIELTKKQYQSEACPYDFECQLENWYDEPHSTSNSQAQPYDHLLPQIENGINNCLDPLKRLDIYAEASMLGHIASLYRWSMLIGFGSEFASHNCGIEDFSPIDQHYHQIISFEQEEICSEYNFPEISDQIKAAIGLVIAAQQGYSEAYIPLSTLISSSIGLGIFTIDLFSPYGQCLIQNIVQDIPIPPEFYSTNKERNGK